MLVVIDTNILVSSLLSHPGKPAQVLDLMLNGMITPCMDSRIMGEYRRVLQRPKFGFAKWEVEALLLFMEMGGLSVVPVPTKLPFVDNEDKKFYEVAKYCNAKLITGNLKHFPKDEWVCTAADFLNGIGRESRISR